MAEPSQKQKLMIAKQQLDKLAIFITSLADYFLGASPTIDAEFQQIKKLLSGKPDYDKAIEISAGLNALLKQESKFLQRKNADTLSQIQKSLRQIIEIDVVDSDIKSEIKGFIENLQGQENGVSSTPVSHFETALSLVKKALKNNLVVTNQQDKDAQKELHSKITQELQALIGPYYLKNKQDKTLSEVQQKLNAGLGHKELLECCLIMIRFVAKDVINQAGTATKLIHEIHGSLTKINTGIKTTISHSKARLEKRQKRNQAMQAQMSAMEHSLSETTKIEDLKRQTTEYLSELQNSMHIGEQEERAEQEKVIGLLQSMQKRLESLENKAQAYKAKFEAQRYNALTDPLTKLPNRLAYEEQVLNVFTQSQTSNKPAFVAVLDIDHFKSINDKYGHSVGDKTLQIISAHIQKHISDSDFLARWGGEEFVALLLDETAEGAFKKAEQVRINIAKLPFKFKGNKVKVTVSIGLVNVNDFKTPDQAFDAADKLLYQAKSKGRNQTCI